MEYLRAGKLPPEVVLSAHHVERLFPADLEEAVELDDTTADLVGDLEDVRQRLRVLGLEEQRLKDRLANELGSAVVGVWRGHPVVTWRPSTRTTIDTARLRRDLPDVAHAYAVTSTIRAMRVIG